MSCRRNRVEISIFAKLKVLPVSAGFLATILNFLIILMSRIGVDCIIVFHTLENLDFVVGIVSIYQCFAKLQVFRFFSFQFATLDFPLI